MSTLKLIVRYLLSGIGGGCAGLVAAHLHEPLLAVAILALYARLLFAEELAS